MTNLMMCGHKSDKSDADGIPYCDCGGALCYSVDRKRTSSTGVPTMGPETYYTEQVATVALDRLRREAAAIAGWANIGRIYGRSPFVINEL